MTRRRKTMRLTFPPEVKKWLEDGARGKAVRHDSRSHLAIEAEVFSGAAGALIRCINDAIKVVVDRDNWPDIVHMTEAEFKSDVPELLTVFEEILHKIIKNSSVDGVPAEQQNLVVDLMIQILTSVMADARKRLS
jgi:hypothetical protein